MFNRLKSLRNTIRRHPCYVATRRHWMGKEQRRRLEEGRVNDPDVNLASTPPEDEDIRLICVWAVEYFPPSYTDDLERGLRNLGWDEPTFFSDPIRGIQKMRERHAGGHMTHLGYLVPKGSTLFLGPTARVAQLPEGVDYALADLYAVTPSLHCVVVCFVLEEYAASRLDRALRATYRTEAEPVRGGWQHSPPDRQKAKRISEIRQDLSKSVVRWFRKNLHGLFSSGLLYGEMPICEGITTQVAEPFPAPSERDGALASYTSMLGIEQEFGAWRCQKAAALKVRFPRDGDRNGQYHAILATKEPDPTGSHLGGQLMDAEELHPTHALVSPWLSIWGLIPLLRGYVRLVRDVRDSPALRDADQKFAALILEKFRGHLAYSIDISDVASELSVEPVGRFPSSQSVPFDPCSPGQSERSLLDFLDGKIKGLASWVQGRERALRDQVVQISSLLGIEENIRTQTKLRRMTWWVLALSVFAIGIAVLSLAVSLFDLWAGLANLSGD